MWGKITRKIKSWAYEEVEVEEVIEEEINEVPKQKQVTRKNLPKQSQTQAKIAYKYPQNRPVKFSSKEEDSPKINQKRKQTNQKMNKNHKNNYHSVYHPGTNSSPTISLKRNQDLSKMEEVPAYLRKERNRTKPKQQADMRQARERLKQEEIIEQRKQERLKRGSSPDELDAIYRKIEERANIPIKKHQKYSKKMTKPELEKEKIPSLTGKITE